MKPDQNKTMSVVLAETICYSAGTALLIFIANTYASFFFCSLFALVPFLWRAMRSSRTNAILLGMMTATFLCLAVMRLNPFRPAGFFIMQLLALNILFIIYALGVNLIARAIGFNAIFMALLWLPVEYLVRHYLDPKGILSLSGDKSATVYQIGSLFGLLMVSFAVVLVNSLILIALEQTFKIRRTHKSLKSLVSSRIQGTSLKTPPKTRPYFLFDRRAPPPRYPSHIIRPA